MIRVLCIIIVVTVCGSAQAAKRPAPTAAEIVECTPDAMSLCIPTTGFNRKKIFDCMRAHKAQLGASCRAVFERHHL